MNKLLPALPTILIAAILSIDFDGIISNLYLMSLIVIPGFSILSIILYITFAFLSKSLRSISATTFLTLFLASLLFHAIQSPAKYVVRDLTPYNRVSAIIHDTYINKDKFEFTIVAIGHGSKNNFSLDSGYANISVNGDYYKGPSLHYTLNPKVQIEHKGRYVAASEPNIIASFSSHGMGDIASTQYASKFRAHLIELSSTYHLPIPGRSTLGIGLTPEPNTVYRLMFTGVSIFALIFSLLVYSKPFHSHAKVN